jgi:hypothetical protein
MSKTEVTTNIIPLLYKHDVIKAAFFGSLVAGGFTEKSDVDILIEFPKGKSLLDLVHLKQEIEELISKKVDLVTYNSLHPLLRESILSEQEVFYEKKS